MFSPRTARVGSAGAALLACLVVCSCHWLSEPPASEAVKVEDGTLVESEQPWIQDLLDRGTALAVGDLGRAKADDDWELAIPVSSLQGHTGADASNPSQLRISLPRWSGDDPDRPLPVDQSAVADRLAQGETAPAAQRVVVELPDGSRLIDDEGTRVPALAVRPEQVFANLEDLRSSGRPNDVAITVTIPTRRGSVAAVLAIPSRRSSR